MSKVPEWNEPRKHPSEWTEADLQEWIGSMSPAEKKFVRKVWRQVEAEERAAKKQTGKRKPPRVA